MDETPHKDLDKTLEACNAGAKQCDHSTFWTMLRETRFSWLDIILMVIVSSLPGILLALIPW